MLHVLMSQSALSAVEQTWGLLLDDLKSAAGSLLWKLTK